MTAKTPEKTKPPRKGAVGHKANGHHSGYAVTEIGSNEKPAEFPTPETFAAREAGGKVKKTPQWEQLEAEFGAQLNTLDVEALVALIDRVATYPLGYSEICRKQLLQPRDFQDFQSGGGILATLRTELLQLLQRDAQLVPTGAVRKRGNDPEHGKTKDIPLNRISTCPFNPRQDFDEAAIKELSESMKRHGQLQNALVRAGGPGVGNYELIAGERRWRAAKLAKLERLRCDIIDVTDEEAAELAGEENYRRKQLNAIEEARWFKTLIEKCGYTQAALGKKLGLSQPQIANRLRLLELPQEWQDRVTSGKLSASNARLMAPWIDLPGVVKQVEEAVKLEPEISTRDFEDQVNEALWSHSRTLDRNVSDGPKFTLTAAVRAELDIRKTPKRFGSGEDERAFNVEAFQRHQREAKKSGGKKTKPSARPLYSAPKPVDGPQPWERRPLWNSWWTEQLQAVVKITPALCDRLLILAAAGIGNFDRSFCDTMKKEWNVKGWHFLPDKFWGRLRALSDDKLRAFAHRMIEQTLQQAEDLVELKPLARQLGVKPEKTWKPAAEWFAKFSDKGLEKLAKSVFPKSHVFPVLKPQVAASRKEYVAHLVEHWPAGTIPKQLAEPK